ncbi:hypothetical protein T11_1926 [Trichinella zimbabwensis]|uniref:Uncharacterized protein n=1 Tax=Trichinella zimbabwensis TaxID=268475 RepID=A0A0V1H986_9BILA|nr:hypothetical protein T11_1926 [Trichinella zimbabwensis]
MVSHLSGRFSACVAIVKHCRVILAECNATVCHHQLSDENGRLLAEGLRALDLD